jgi:lysophospholipase L1-like esterase
MSMHWQNWVALGDSLSFGFGDPVEGIAKVSWVEQVADVFQALNPNFRYINLAQPGLKTCEVIANQLSTALSLNPDLISVQVGSNDVVERSWNPQNYYEALSSVVQPLRETQATILLLTCHNSAGLPRKLGRFAERFKEMVGVIRAVSHEQNAIFVDLSSSLAGSDIAHWSTDRWHPNARGYQEASKVIVTALKHATS